MLPRFFDLLTTTERIADVDDLGLAPPLAERIVTLYGGTVTAENLATPGIRLTVRLQPTAPPRGILPAWISSRHWLIHEYLSVQNTDSKQLIRTIRAASILEKIRNACAKLDTLPSAWRTTA